MVTVSVKCAGKLVYSFNLPERQVFKNLVAGKDTRTAIKLLLHMQGVDQVTIALSRLGANLPTEISSISIVILRRGIS